MVTIAQGQAWDQKFQTQHHKSIGLIRAMKPRALKYATHHMALAQPEPHAPEPSVPPPQPQPPPQPPRHEPPEPEPPPPPEPASAEEPLPPMPKPAAETVKVKPGPRIAAAKPKPEAVKVKPVAKVAAVAAKPAMPQAVAAKAAEAVSALRDVKRRKAFERKAAAMLAETERIVAARKKHKAAAPMPAPRPSKVEKRVKPRIVERKRHGQVFASDHKAGAGKGERGSRK